MEEWSKLIFSEDIAFEEKARRVFEYQRKRNPVYRRYCESLGKVGAFAYHPEPDSGSEARKMGNDPGKSSPPSAGDNLPVEEIPLLPVRAFRETGVTAFPGEEHELVFKSSGTSGMRRSVHRVKDRSLYETSLLNGFRHFYDPGSAVIWGYIPGYGDNPHSSLVYMIRTLIEQDESGLNRFLSPDRLPDSDEIARAGEGGKRLILFGAAFGLLDLAEQEKISLPSDAVVVETGGMKTHRREVPRGELHRRLAEGFDLDSGHIHSEYGMAELLSQAYATGGKWFRSVPWMKVSIRNPDNAFEVLPPHREGLIGVADLANVYSCSFLLTGDKGVADRNGRFRVTGRWNPKDLRGCNFLIGED